MSRFQFVADHRHAFEVKRLCQSVEVARSAYYAWSTAAPSRAARAAADAVLADRVRAVQDPKQGGDRAYGAPRVTAELNDGAQPQDRVNHKRVARVMRTHHLPGLRLRRRVRTTIPDPSQAKVPDLMKRDFTATAPNRKYVACPKSRVKALVCERNRPSGRPYSAPGSERQPHERPSPTHCRGQNCLIKALAVWRQLLEPECAAADLDVVTGLAHQHAQLAHPND